MAAAVGEPLADVEDVLPDDGLDEGSVGALGSRRVRAIAIAGVAALVGFGLGYLAIRRARPDLLAGLSLPRIRPTAMPVVWGGMPVVELHIPRLAEIRVPDWRSFGRPVSRASRGPGSAPRRRRSGRLSRPRSPRLWPRPSPSGSPPRR